jgi:hypothetical protein
MKKRKTPPPEISQNSKLDRFRVIYYMSRASQLFLLRFRLFETLELFAQTLTHRGIPGIGGCQV